MRDDGPHMVSVLAASAERRGERVKGRNGVNPPPSKIITAAL